MKKLLLTGFDPFGGGAVNPAWEAVQRMPDRVFCVTAGARHGGGHHDAVPAGGGYRAGTDGGGGGDPVTVRVFVFPTDGGTTEEKIGQALYRVTGEEKTLRREENGKPFVTDGSTFVSVSHTDALTFVAVAERNIGLDAELFSRPTDPRLTRRFSQKEKAAAGETDAGRLKIWVRKEAYGKFTGRGLAELGQDTFALPGRFLYFAHAGHILALYSEERVDRVSVLADKNIKCIIVH